MNNNKKILIIVIALIVVTFVTGMSYALWQLILKQESTNVVNTACFRIEFQDKNEINLQSAYPIKDEEGLKLEPYHFTIENTCTTNATYQINLEELIIESKKLSNEYVKASLNNSNGKLLNTYEEVSKTISNADASHKLTTGVLKGGEKKSFDLRLWLDENTPANENVINASFQSKVTIIAIQKEGLPEVRIAMSEQLNEITVEIDTVQNPKDEELTYFYQLNNESEIESSETTHVFTNLSDGEYKIRGRAETKDGIILSEKEVDVVIAYEKVYISNTGNDKTGNGSVESPFASLQPAYNKVKSGGEMILLSDIIATSTTNMDIENKEVILRSKEENIYSIFRDDTLITQLLNITNSNVVNTTNIIFDGKNVNAKTALIRTDEATLNLKVGTIIQNSINNGKDGGGISASNSSLNMNAIKVVNNQVLANSLAQGGGIRATNSVLNITDSEISNNVSSLNSTNGGGGGLFLFNSQATLMNCIIQNNSGTFGGGISFDASDRDVILNIVEGSIRNNMAGIIGGGIEAYRQTTSIQSIIYLKGVVIENNTAPTGANTYAGNGAKIIEQSE